MAFGRRQKYRESQGRIWRHLAYLIQHCLPSSVFVSDVFLLNVEYFKCENREMELPRWKHSSSKLWASNLVSGCGSVDRAVASGTREGPDTNQEQFTVSKQQKKDKWKWFIYLTLNILAFRSNEYNFSYWIQFFVNLIDSFRKKSFCFLSLLKILILFYRFEQDQDSGKSLENAFLKIWMNNVKWKIFKKSFIKLKFLKERESEGDRRFSNGTY